MAPVGARRVLGPERDRVGARGPEEPLRPEGCLAAGGERCRAKECRHDARSSPSRGKLAPRIGARPEGLHVGFWRLGERRRVLVAPRFRGRPLASLVGRSEQSWPPTVRVRGADAPRTEGARAGRGGHCRCGSVLVSSDSCRRTVLGPTCTGRTASSVRPRPLPPSWRRR